MDIEFDPEKDKANQKKHSLSLADAIVVFADISHVIIPSIRLIDGEERFKAVGIIGGRCHTVIYVWRDATCRFI